MDPSWEHAVCARGNCFHTDVWGRQASPPLSCRTVQFWYRAEAWFVAPPFLLNSSNLYLAKLSIFQHTQQSRWLGSQCSSPVTKRLRLFSMPSVQSVSPARDSKAETPKLKGCTVGASAEEGAGAGGPWLLAGPARAGSGPSWPRPPQPGGALPRWR